MRLILFLILIFPSFIFASDIKNNPLQEITLGYYNQSITTARPLQKSTSIASRGGILAYEREMYRHGTHFTIDLGGSVSYWERASSGLADFAVFPALKFWWNRDARVWTPYLLLSVGPSYITRSQFGAGDDLGSNFIFQDILGVCLKMGQKNPINTCVKFQHYSNANLFMPNHGFDVPVLFSLGYAFY